MNCFSPVIVSFYKGSDETVNFTYVEHIVSGNPQGVSATSTLDLTGCVIEVKLYNSETGDEFLARSGVIDPDQVENKGQYTLTFNPLDFSTINGTTYYKSEVKLTDSNNKVSRARGANYEIMETLEIGD